MHRVNRSMNTLGCAAQVLGQSSLWIGVMVAIGWTVGFALIARHVSAYHGADPGLVLPVEPPLIGLALGLAGVVLARMGGHRVTGPTLVGLILCVEALVLAIAVMLGWLG